MRKEIEGRVKEGHLFFTINSGDKDKQRLFGKVSIEFECPDCSASCEYEFSTSNLFKKLPICNNCGREYSIDLEAIIKPCIKYKK